MLEMFSVVVPVFLRVTGFLAAVAPTTVLPHTNDAGVTVTVGPVPLGLTVKLMVVLLLNEPEVPVTGGPYDDATSACCALMRASAA